MYKYLAVALNHALAVLTYTSLESRKSLFFSLVFVSLFWLSTRVFGDFYGYTIRLYLDFRYCFLGITDKSSDSMFICYSFYCSFFDVLSNFCCKYSSRSHSFGCLAARMLKLNKAVKHSIIYIICIHPLEGLSIWCCYKIGLEWYRFHLALSNAFLCLLWENKFSPNDCVPVVGKSCKGNYLAIFPYILCSDWIPGLFWTEVSWMPVLFLLTRHFFKIILCFLPFFQVFRTQLNILGTDAD